MEKDTKKMCERCGWFMDLNESFCPECGMENFNPLDTKQINDDKSKPMGAWILVCGRAKNGKETNPPLYTRIRTDDIKHKATGKRFCRGRYVLFRENGGEKTQLIEDTDEYKIIYHKSIFEKIVIKS